MRHWDDVYPRYCVEPSSFTVHALGVLRGGVRPRVDDLRGAENRQASKNNVSNLINNMIEAVAVIASSVAAALALLVTTCCFHIRRLRCATIECCGSKCTRAPMTTDELEMDTL